MSKIGMLVVGMAFGIALVLACEGHRADGEEGDGRTDAAIGAGADAQAAPSDCDTWQVADTQEEVVESTPNNPHDLPAGWEPFAVAFGPSGRANMFLRRCRP